MLCPSVLNYSMDTKQFFINEVPAVKTMNIVTIRRVQRNILNKTEEETIISLKGSARGVKNRVRTGIATFIQDQSRKVIDGKNFPIFTSCSELLGF